MNTTTHKPGTALTVLTLTSHVESRFKGVDASLYDAPRHLIVKGISDAAMRLGVSAPVEVVTRKEARAFGKPTTNPTALARGEVDGLILCSEDNGVIIQSLHPSLPCITVPRSRSPHDLDSAGPEHMHGIERLVRYLYQLGHQAIGFVGLMEHPTWAVERFAGYLHAMDELGLKPSSAWMINVIGDSYPDDEVGAPVAAATRDGVTAWVCVSDGLAQRVYHALTAAGLKVPDDVSITGFDGVRHMKDCPELTTLVVPWQEIGEGALAAVLERIENPSATAVHREYVGRFREGATTAPPGKRRKQRS